METNDIKKNDALDIMSLVKEASSVDNVAVEKVVAKSPLDQMIEQKDDENYNAMVIEKKEEEPLIYNKELDDGLKSIDEYMDEQDQLIEKAKQVEVKQVPSKPTDMAALMMELDDVKDGKVNPEAKFIQKVGDHPSMSVKIEGNELDKLEEINTDTPEGVEKQSILSLIIDKTNMGANFSFTDEEKEKVKVATEIHVTEIEELALGTLIFDKDDDDAFLDNINEYELTNSRVSAMFPASGFKGAMKGLSFGEMGDVALNPELVNVERIRKQLSVIYSKLIDMNIPKFKSFEDFLNNFAYTDLEYATNALVIATFPEIDDISLMCNNPRCKNTFYHKFAPRKILQTSESSITTLNHLKTIIDSNDISGQEVFNNAPLKKRKYIRLPHSKVIVELGIASCAEWLDMIMTNILDPDYVDKHNDVNNNKRFNTTLLSTIRTLIVPKKNGKVKKFTKHDDMIEILYSLPQEDFLLSIHIVQKYLEAYRVTFAVDNVICPHCQTKTERVGVDINTLLFFKSQKLESTLINVDNIQVL